MLSLSSSGPCRCCTGRVCVCKISLIFLASSPPCFTALISKIGYSFLRPFIDFLQSPTFFCILTSLPAMCPPCIAHYADIPNLLMLISCLACLTLTIPPQPNALRALLPGLHLGLHGPGPDPLCGCRYSCPFPTLIHSHPAEPMPLW